MIIKHVDPRGHVHYRLPAAPLLALARAALDQAGVDPNYVQLGIFFDTCRETVMRWEQTGLTLLHADEHAVRLGFHPALIWPEWWEIPINEVQAAGHRRPRHKAGVS